jgi:hypothetical protein
MKFSKKAIFSFMGVDPSSSSTAVFCAIDCAVPHPIHIFDLGPKVIILCSFHSNKIKDKKDIFCLLTLIELTHHYSWLTSEKVEHLKVKCQNSLMSLFTLLYFTKKICVRKTNNCYFDFDCQMTVQRDNLLEVYKF